MKRTLLATLVFFAILGLTTTAAATLDRRPSLAMAAAIVVLTTVGGDLATTRLRRQKRSCHIQSVEPIDSEARSATSTLPTPEPEQGTFDKLPEPPADDPGDLRFIPRTLEPESRRSWQPAGKVQPEARKPGGETVVSQIVGQKIGPYQVLEKIGQGGMATVYKAEHRELGRPVAIKVLDPSLVGSPEMAAAFRREAQTIANLRHPNVVHVYDFGSLDLVGSHYLAMEFVDGTDLQAQIERRREKGPAFNHEEILDLLGQVAAALDYAHDQGIVHRDVKPGNVLLRATGQPILSDFGLATLRRTRATLITTIGKNVLGTPEYTAPEQALDAQAAGPQSDVYSLGCILYEMVTGHLPFEADSPLSIALMHINEAPTPPRRHAPDLAPEAEAVVLRALAKEPGERFATATEMVNALRRVWQPHLESSRPPISKPSAPPLVPPADFTGQVISPYEVLEKVGQGGMAAVYRGYRADLKRHVAIKVLGQSGANAPATARRFQREAQTVAALRHPHIVHVYDFGSLESAHYLVLEFVEGTDLRAAMTVRRLAKKSWSPAEVLHLVAQVGGALDYAHEQRVVHRDVKPANILTSVRGDHFLTDFGISVVRDRVTRTTTTGEPFGTPEYIAPEQAMNYHGAVPQSDLYSLACILYQMLTGHLLFEADSPLSIALMHISHDPIPPTFYAPELPAAVEAVLLQMLAKDPEDRLPTAAAMGEALQGAWGKDGER